MTILIVLIAFAVLPAYAFAFLVHRDKVEAFRIMDRVLNPPPAIMPLSSLQNMLRPPVDHKLSEPKSPSVETQPKAPDFTYL